MHESWRCQQTKRPSSTSWLWRFVCGLRALTHGGACRVLQAALLGPVSFDVEARAMKMLSMAADAYSVRFPRTLLITRPPTMY